MNWKVFTSAMVFIWVVMGLVGVMIRFIPIKNSEGSFILGAAWALVILFSSLAYFMRNL